MSDAISESMGSVAEHVSALDREFVKIAQEVADADEDQARVAMQGVFRSLSRMAEAARPIIAACPTCKAARVDPNYEQVNKYSGVWVIPKCKTCRDLGKMIAVIEKSAREAAAK